jgi:hypothetical protein
MIAMCIASTKSEVPVQIVKFNVDATDDDSQLLY